MSVPDPVEYTAKIGAVLDTVRRLLDAGSRADLAPLARRAVDDIVGMLEQHGDLAADLEVRLDQAVALYARACAARPPDPEQLADWVLEAAFSGRAVAVADFAAALGDAGLARMKSIVDEVLRGKPIEEKLAIAERLQEEIAEASGDVDGLVAILAAKPPRVDVSLKIVRVLRAAGRHSEAIAYAARVLTPQRTGKPRAAKARTAKPQPKEAPRKEEESIPEYRERIEQLIARKEASAYREAAQCLKKLRTLHKQAGTAEEFTGYVAELVNLHRRKTRLLAEIRSARIALPKG
ncbi:hypothetical protein ATK30_3645 [Amycolatopsis echigonensis]|uniref:Uncharacterized protein n=1 Tax=Amycolatopsis echigonensis TaxID=2576905 RepID=A0A2N3WG30_9PSEU|nr:hypothetical protein [Amycolatopsis niigatensis]PKV92816.1 hypothetical protein ATK30_3645 [Amycolatopsis niigatensis]